MATVPAVNTFQVHPLLQPYLVPDNAGNRCSIVWDVREDPALCARPVVGRFLTASILLLNATEPSVTVLTVRCDALPATWSIEVRNPDGVTLRDVLSSLYKALRRSIRQSDWGSFSTVVRERISAVFHARCDASPKPKETQEQGVLWMDCLTTSTVFGGLTVSTDGEACALLRLEAPTYQSLYQSLLHC